ncbi:hypothetical protein CCR97_29450 [Rhodoplanes elegans]|uniref:DUF4365 domain-containing protein n=1 Tax=Rhodoplanes elegans TaxID=29408 RepID=A0A327KE67_9BRAD|nr:DUF4365 domain-containing protein [Rhodoplanes elegans]MBK5962285.1 hypothetical protein [Rhodoplanes elegans]RAI35672.1 hypothetical protein CH338_18850 [Rhodoplanes elegans]
MPLPREHLLDELGSAYLQAVAAGAGAVISAPRRDYGIDGTLTSIVRVPRRSAPGYKFIPTGAAVDYQLRTTAIAVVDEDGFAFDIDARTYDLIVERTHAAARLYLIVVCFGADAGRWMALDRQRLILNASAFWWTASAPPTRNVSTVRVLIPASNRVTPDTIVELLAAAAERHAT